MDDEQRFRYGFAALCLAIFLTIAVGVAFSDPPTTTCAATSVSCAPPC